MPRPSQAREAILRSAAELFWHGSYESVGVEAICREASVNKGSFYHFFPSKEDVALHLLDRLHEQSRVELLEPAFQADTDPASRFGRFLALLEVHAAESREAAALSGRYPGCPIGNLVLELSTQSERLRLKLEEIIHTYVIIFTGALEAARSAGQLSSSADPHLLAETIASTWQGGMLLAKAHNEPELCTRVFRQVLESTFGRPISVPAPPSADR